MNYWLFVIDGDELIVQLKFPPEVFLEGIASKAVASIKAVVIYLFSLLTN